MEICTRIFEIMDRKKLKMTFLADLLGVSKSVVSTWKSRNTNPPVEYMVQICEFLGITYSFYLTGKESEAVVQLQTNLNADESELLNNYRRLDKRSQHKLHTVIYEELDKKCGDEEAPRPIPFAASGEANITPENYAKIQERLQQFEKKTKELNGG